MEKRTFSRFVVDGSGRIEVSVEYAGRLVPGRLEDLSLRGLFVTADQPIPQGEDVVVTLWPEGRLSGSSLKCRGVVARADGCALGIEIRDMAPGDFTYFRSVVAAISHQPDRVEDELRDFVNPGT